MAAFVNDLVRDERGQDLAEYGIALSVIAVGAALAAVALAQDVSSLWSGANSLISYSVSKL